MDTGKACVLAVLALGCSACVPLVEEYAQYAAKRESERTFELYVPRTDGLRYCLTHPGGFCSASTAPAALQMDTPDREWEFQTYEPDESVNPAGLSDDAVIRSTDDIGASAARDALNHPFQQKLNVMYYAAAAAPSIVSDASLIDARQLADVEGTEEDLHVSFTTTIDELDEYQRLVERATLLDGWSALEEEAQARQFTADTAALNADKRRRTFLSAYFKAYFRSGKVVQLTVDATDLKKHIVAKLQEELPGLSDEDYEALVQQRLEDLGFDASTNRIFGKLDTKKFVTRDGQELQFPGLSASIALGSSKLERSDIDYVAVGTDLIRVLLHALYDASRQVPAVSNATGVSDLQGEPFALRVNDTGRVSEEKFEQIEIRANQIEGVVGAGTGRIIRGISVIALNNEALATVIETAVGLAVRKYTESVLYCWYACGPTATDPNALAAPRPEESPNAVRITVRLGGFPEP